MPRLAEVGVAVGQVAVGGMLAQQSDNVIMPVGAILAQMPQHAGELDGIAKAVRHVMQDAELVGHKKIFCY